MGKNGQDTHGGVALGGSRGGVLTPEFNTKTIQINKTLSYMVLAASTLVLYFYSIILFFFSDCFNVCTRETLPVVLIA